MEIHYYPNYSEIDSMRVVHHSKHIIWFENSRFAFLEKILKMERSEFSRLNIYMPVIELRCKYHKSIFFEDEIIVKTKMYCSKAAHFSFKYWIYYNNDCNKIIVEGRTKHAFVNSDYQLLLNFPDGIKSKILNAKNEFPDSIIMI